MPIASQPAATMSGSRGFVFATTGPEYTTLARRSARTLREAIPACKVDLFTDQSIDDDVFDQIHRLDHSWFRPKMQAIRESRFERTIIMDADLVVLTDISDVFDILDQCDIAAVEGRIRTDLMILPNSAVPRSLPTINSGLLAVKASESMNAFSQAWEDALRGADGALDQPYFREKLFHSGLKFLPLGREYNLIWLDMLDLWAKSEGAPRVLHVRELHDLPPGDPHTSISIEEAIGKERAMHVKNLLASDWSLGGDRDLQAVPPIMAQRRRRLRLERDAAKRPSFSTYQSAVLALASSKARLTLCIIGANDGKYGDPIFSLLESKLADHTDVILFEPQLSLIPFLADNYSFHPSHHIVNAAIGPNTDLKLYAIKHEAWDKFSPPYAKNWPSYRAPTGVTSSRRQHVLDWINKHANNVDRPEALLTELTVPCSPLTSALKSMGKPTDIDILQVDTEGFDDEVIYASELEETQPKIIFCEYEHLLDDKKQRLKKYLEKNYFIIAEGDDLLAVRKG